MPYHGSLVNMEIEGSYSIQRIDTGIKGISPDNLLPLWKEVAQEMGHMENYSQETMSPLQHTQKVRK